jgi:hypothetical protein
MKKSSVRFILIILVLNFIFLTSVYSYRNEIKTLVNVIKIYSMGNTDYINEKIIAQVSDSNPKDQSFDIKTIQTSVLPLRLKTISLRDLASFASDGGSITTANGRLLAMDRLGSLYLFEDGNVKQISTPKIPNRMGK